MKRSCRDAFICLSIIIGVFVFEKSDSSSKIYLEMFGSLTILIEAGLAILIEADKGG